RRSAARSRSPGAPESARREYGRRPSLGLDPGRFQRGFLGRVFVHADDLAPADGDDPGLLVLLDLDPAPLSSASPSEPDDDSLSRVDDVLRLEVEVVHDLLEAR